MMDRKFSNKPRKNQKEDTNGLRNGKQKVEWKGYVNFELNDQFKADFKKRMGQGQSFVSGVGEELADGYSLKVRYDLRNKAFQATLYCENPDHKQAGWALAARASDPYTALERVCYIHLLVLDRRWDVDSDETAWDDEKW